MDELRIIDDNSQRWIFDKPAGLATQGGVGVKQSLDRVIESELLEKAFLVHRLDKETSGLILVAKNSAAAAKFSRYFNTDQVEKHYKAIVYGRFPLEMEIVEELKQKGKMVAAHTSARLIRHYGLFSLLSIHLHTGRMHQIRLHLQKKGFPLIGDDKYGDFTLNRYIKRETSLDQLMLYANYMHIKAEKIDLNLELPSHFSSFLTVAPSLKKVETKKTKFLTNKEEIRDKR